MGHIVTPKGVDFVIQSPPLTDKERKELSEFIAKRKAQMKKAISTKKKKKPAANNG